MTRSQTRSETEGDSEETKAAKLQRVFNVEQLRRFTHQHDVPRQRGDDKTATAERLAEEKPGVVDKISEDGRYEVRCSHCELKYAVDEAEVAEADAKAHKSKKPFHFPKAVDTEEDEAIYG